MNWESHRAKQEPDKILVFAFDFQKRKQLPYLATNEVYYKRQHAVYNCSNHDCGSEKGYFRMWTEATASRGPAEISSCIWHWLNSFKHLPKEFVAFSDSCGGQNRNIIIALFCMFVIQERNIECIDHIILVSGHSFMSCDENFGVDEREKRKHEQVYTLSKWIAKRARNYKKMGCPRNVKWIVSGI